jgi:WD40 repeat protein
VAFSPRAAILVTAFGGAIDGVDRLWDVTDLSRPRRLSQFEGGQPMALSPDGRTVATVAFSGQTTLWDVVDPRRPAEIATLPAGDGSKLWGQDRRSPRTAGSWPPPATTGSSCGMWPARPGPGRCATGPGVRDQRGSWR